MTDDEYLLALKKRSRLIARIDNLETILWLAQEQLGTLNKKILDHESLIRGDFKDLLKNT